MRLEIWEDTVLIVKFYWCERYLHSCRIACAGMQFSKEAAAFGSSHQYVHLNTLLLFRILAESPAFGSPSGYCTEDIFLYLVTPVFLINISVVLNAHFIFYVPYFHMCTWVDVIMHKIADHLWMLTCDGLMDDLISTIPPVPVARNLLIKMPLKCTSAQ